MHLPNHICILRTFSIYKIYFYRTDLEKPELNSMVSSEICRALSPFFSNFAHRHMTAIIKIVFRDRGVGYSILQVNGIQLTLPLLPNCH